MNKTQSGKNVAVRAKAASFLLAVALCAFGDVSAYAEPRVLASVFEMATKADPSQPWPAGLRMVLYDSGQVLTLTRPFTSTSDGEVNSGFYSPAEAARIADKLRESLAAVSNTLNPDLATPGTGATILQLRGEDRDKYVDWWAPSHPCLSGSESQLDEHDLRVRHQLDERFIRACDSLTQMRAPQTTLWTPSQIRIHLTSASPSEAARPVPPEWIPEQKVFRRRLSMCAEARPAAIGLTKQLEVRTTRAQAIGQILKMTDGTYWKIRGVEYVLPGAISYVSGGGDNISLTTLSDGACRPAARH